MTTTPRYVTPTAKGDVRWYAVGEPITTAPAAPQTRNQHMQAAIDFLRSYHAQYGYFPAPQAIGRFHLTPTEAAYVWDSVREERGNDE